jgi:hypothetical protein
LARFLSLGQISFFAAHINEASQNLSEKEALLAAHNKEIQKVRNEMNRTHRLYLDGSITSQGFAQFYKPAEEHLNQLLTELPKLQAEVDYLKINDLSAEQILAEARTLYEKWPTLERDQKRQIAESLIEKIVIGTSEIDITFSCLPTSEETVKSQHILSGLRRTSQRRPRAKDPPPGGFSRKSPSGRVAPQSKIHEGYSPLSRLAIGAFARKQRLL